MVAQTDLSDWLLRLYASTGSRVEFTDFLGQLSRRLGGHIAGLHAEELDRRRGVVSVTVGVTESEFRELQQGYADYRAENLWMLLGAPALMRDGYADSANVCEHRVIARTDYYRKVLAPKDIDHSIAVLLEQAPDGRHAVLTINRAGARRPFRPEHHQFLEAMLPHLRQAFGLLRQHEATVYSEVDAAIAWLPAHAVALVLDADLIVLAATDAARANVDRGAAPYTFSGNRLRFRDQKVQALVARSVLAACGTGVTNDRVVAAGPGGSHWLVSVVPCPGRLTLDAARSRPLALLVMQDSSGLPPDGLQRLTDLLHWTPSEARLGISLRQTRDLAASAQALSISWHTARSQLKSMLQKSGCHKQTQLMRLIDLCLDAH